LLTGWFKELVHTKAKGRNIGKENASPRSPKRAAYYAPLRKGGGRSFGRKKKLEIVIR